MSLLSGGLAFARPVVSMPGDKVRISSWIDSRFSKGAALPFSFALDGVPSSEFMGRWKRSRQVLPSADPSAVSFRYIWTGSKEGLSVICDVTGYPESNLVEWVVRFRNISGNNSGQISDVKVADMRMKFPSAGPVSLHYAEGTMLREPPCLKVTEVSVSSLPAAGRRARLSLSTTLSLRRPARES